MRIFYFILLLPGPFSAVYGENCESKKAVFCYWGSWAKYRSGVGEHTIRNIIPQYCTHIVYSFAGINLSGELDSLNPTEDIGNGGFKNFVNLKNKHPCVKFLLGVGGWNEGSEKFSLMVENEENRTKFVKKVIQFMVYFGFDGLDLDWEYPGSRGGIPEDKQNLIMLLKDLNKKLKSRKRILTAAVSASMAIINAGYEIRELCAELDFVSIMGYDLNDPQKTSIHSPLYPEYNEPNNRDTIHTAINYFKTNGCPNSKIVLGMPAYGRTYTLKNKSSIAPGSNVSGPGKSGPYTKEEGFLGYNEICKMLMEETGWKTQLLSKNSAKYSWKDYQWVSYDDAETALLKATYAYNEQLAGVMIWSIDTDDFHGMCFNESYPLLLAVNRGLRNPV